MNPRFYPSTRTLCEVISSVRAKLSTSRKRLVCQRSGVQKMSFLLTVLQISMVLCKVHISNPWRKIASYLELSSVLSVTLACHAGYPKSATRKIIVGSRRSLKLRVACFPHPSSYSRVSGRDSCKGGRIVTAPVWYPKIWAKFSLFALQTLQHGIHLNC